MHRSCFSKIEKQRLCEDQLDIWDRGKRANNTRMPIICQMNAMPVRTSLLHAYRYVKIRGKFVYGFATTGIVSPYDGTVAENKIEENFWSKPLSYTCIFFSFSFFACYIQTDTSKSEGNSYMASPWRGLFRIMTAQSRKTKRKFLIQAQKIAGSRKSSESL